MKHIVLALTCASFLTGCISIDKDLATQQRLNELCAKIDTQHLSHCPGNHIPPPPQN